MSGRAVVPARPVCGTLPACIGHPVESTTPPPRQLWRASPPQFGEVSQARC